MKSNAMTATTARLAADRAVRDEQRVLEMGLLARFLQPVGVALAVAEAQRVGRHLAAARCAVQLPSSKVQPRRSGAVARMWWPQCGQTLRFFSRSVWKIICWHSGHCCQRFSGTSRLREQRADLRADIFGEPAHACLRRRAVHRRAPSAPHALGQRAHLVQHAPDRVGPAAALLVEAAASVSIRAEATTAASPSRTASAACAGVRTPKPIATGRSVTRRMRGMLAARSSAVARAGAGDAGDADVIDEARAAVQHERHPRIVRGGRDQPDDVEPARVGVRQPAGRPPRSAGRRRSARRRRPPPRPGRTAPVRRRGSGSGSPSGSPASRRPRGGNRAPSRACAAQRGAGLQRALARGLDRRAVRHRVGERHADLDQVGARRRHSAQDRAARSRRPGPRPRGTGSARPRRAPAPRSAAKRAAMRLTASPQMLGDGEDVLVAAPAQIHQDDLVLAASPARASSHARARAPVRAPG